MIQPLRPLISVTFVALFTVSTVACGSTKMADGSSSSPASTAISSTTLAGATATSTMSGLRQATWASGVAITYGDGTITFKSNGIPNHARQKQYAVPNGGTQVPSASTAHAVADPTVAQTYSFTISTSPKKASKTTSASNGTIGVMISGAVLFNPYEGDGSTVATSSNFTVKDDAGNDVAFLDSCNGHPTPAGQYHYHGLPACITSVIDVVNGPSHVLGIAFDGFPIYGDRDVNGQTVTSKQLDLCNGITSATPEFPQGIYHYVLLSTSDASSSIKCFSGSIDASLATSMPGMPAGQP